MSTRPTSLTTTSLALRIVAFRETRAYMILLVAPGAADFVAEELKGELEVFGEDLTVGAIAPSLGVEHLLKSIRSNNSNVLLVNAETLKSSLMSPSKHKPWSNENSAWLRCAPGRGWLTRRSSARRRSISCLGIQNMRNGWSCLGGETC